MQVESLSRNSFLGDINFHIFGSYEVALRCFRLAMRSKPLKSCVFKSDPSQTGIEPLRKRTIYVISGIILLVPVINAIYLNYFLSSSLLLLTKKLHNWESKNIQIEEQKQKVLEITDRIFHCAFFHEPSLDLTFNFFESSGSIKLPDIFSFLKDHLINLDFSNIYFEKFSEDIDQLHHLRRLSLSSCKFEELPNWIKKLTALEDLDISQIRLQKFSEGSKKLNTLGTKLVEFFEKIKDLPVLKKLNISGNSLVRIPECITEFPSLKELDITGSLICKQPDWLNTDNIKVVIERQIQEDPPKGFLGLKIYVDVYCR